MIAWIPVLLAAGVLGLSSWYDIRTREVDDWLTEGFIGAAVVYQLALLFMGGTIMQFASAILAGSVCFLIGYAMFITAQWGGADVKLLAGLGFLFGNYGGGFLFMFDYFINIFAVAFVYAIIYSLLMPLKKPGIVKDFKGVVKKSWMELERLAMILVVVLVGMAAALRWSFGVEAALIPGLMLPLLGVALLIPVFWALLKYVKVVEQAAFRLKRKVGTLVEFDLLIEHIVREGGKIKRIKEKGLTDERRKKVEMIVDASEPNGLTPEQIVALKRLVKEGKLKPDFVVKWGLPFVPVFLAALPLTLWAGNVLLRIVAG